MFAFTAHVWNARRISRCQAPGRPVGLSRLARLLGPTGVRAPSAAKLSVRWFASGQGMPKDEGRDRSSRYSNVPSRRDEGLMGPHWWDGSVGPACHARIGGTGGYGRLPGEMVRGGDFSDFR